MALPPSRLKQVLDQESPKAMYRALCRTSFISLCGRLKKREILATICRTLERRDPPGPPIPGPTPMDTLAGNLVPFLNERGRDAYYATPIDPA